MGKREEATRQKCESVMNTLALLQKAVRSGHSDEQLRISCETQRGVAKMKGDGIQSMVLNTFKKYADMAVPGGFSAIDTLRNSILEASTKGDPSDDNEPRIDLYDLAKRTMTIQSRAYRELLVLAKEFAEEDPGKKRRLKEHHQLYRVYFGPTSVESE